MVLPQCVPAGQLPQCWSDDVRMNALFAPFRLKSVNPESWEMKMKFWSDMLRVWCRYRKDPVVTAADAKFAFQRNGRTPACLDIVVEEMFRNGDMSPLSKYQQVLHNGPEGWVRWGAKLAFKPAVFALSAVSSLLPMRQGVDNDGLPKASIDGTQRFVLESAVKEQALSLLENYPPGVDRVGSIDDLAMNCDWQGERETFEVLLGYLVAQGSAVKRGDVVKLAEPNKKAAPVTESDEALAKLVSAEARLQRDSERLSREVAAADADARAALQLGSRVAAKNHLRRKHRAAARAARCGGALDNVRHLLQQLRDSQDNTAILNTYRTSSEAMKRNMKESNMTEDAVHDTMDDLKEVMDTYNEVSRALGAAVEDVDADELEQELRELLSGEGPSGGTPAKEREASKPTPAPRKQEKEFIFDGEERVLAELNDLSIEDSSPKEKESAREKKAVAVGETELPSTPKQKPVKSWYPPADTWGNNNDESYEELRQDSRLHPGQRLSVEHSSPSRLYNADFLVQDHRRDQRVWLFNDDVDSLNNSYSTEPPNPSTPGFQKTPGGERKKDNQKWPTDSQVDDLERRLKNLRGFNL